MIHMRASKRLWAGVALSLAVTAAVAVPVASAHTANPPTNLTVDLNDDNKPKLSWSAPSNTPTMYQIYRKGPDEQWFTTLTMVFATDTTWTEEDWTDLKPGRNEYKVEAVHSLFWEPLHVSSLTDAVSILVPNPDGTGGL